MAKVRVEGHLEDDRCVMVCSGDSPDQISWARDEDTGHVFVVLEQIPPEDVFCQADERPRCFGIRLYGGNQALPTVGRILEVA